MQIFSPSGKKFLIELDSDGYPTSIFEEELDSEGEPLIYENTIDNHPDYSLLLGYQTYKYENGNWIIVPNYQNVTFYHKQTKEVKLYQKNEIPDFETYTLVAPVDNNSSWDSESNSWILDLTQIKNKLKMKLKCRYVENVKNYDRLTEVIYNDIVWDGGQFSKEMLTNKLKDSRLDSESIIYWKNKNNDWIGLTLIQLAELLNVVNTDIVVYGETKYEELDTDKQLLASLTTLEEIDQFIKDKNL